VLAFKREAYGDEVVVVLNLSASPQNIQSPDGIAEMRLVLGGDAVAEKSGELALEPWGYRVWSKER
jgi:hypothetical protein